MEDLIVANPDLLFAVSQQPKTGDDLKLLTNKNLQITLRLGTN